MFEKKKNPDIENLLENSPKYPERASEDKSDVIMEDVYAGPEMPPEMPIAMATYMGPDMMNFGIGTQAFFMPQPPAAPKQDPADSDSVFCSMCGYRNSKNSRFCCECGNPFPKTEESDNQ